MYLDTLFSPYVVHIKLLRTSYNGLEGVSSKLKPEEVTADQSSKAVLPMHRSGTTMLVL
jgi:hypothetical protein